jgi:hypothetical protein
MEFNLNPYSMKNEKLTYFNYNKRVIPIVCEGWNRIGNFYYREYTTSEGVIMVSTLIYKLNDSSIRY